MAFRKLVEGKVLFQYLNNYESNVCLISELVQDNNKITVHSYVYFTH